MKDSICCLERKLASQSNSFFRARRGIQGDFAEGQARIQNATVLLLDIETQKDDVN
jgi:hypothetical protein